MLSLYIEYKTIAEAVCVRWTCLRADRYGVDSRQPTAGGKLVVRDERIHMKDGIRCCLKLHKGYSTIGKVTAGDAAFHLSTPNYTR